MSSFIGHSLAALTISIDTNHHKDSPYYNYGFLWIIWLIIIALIPDLDYIIPFLHPSANEGLRITHSLFLCQIIPLLTLIYLKFKGKNNTIFLIAAIQVILAGFSHIALDFLVGVTPLPLLYPLSNEVFKLPFGILPSAGKISLFNYYMYYNLGIELGILLPLSICYFYIKKSKKFTWKKLFIITLLLLISGRFIYWAYHLTR